MSRALRIEYPGAFYHVLNRGQRREAIVRDEQDRERFVSGLERTARLFCTPIHSYCLMTNHFHLILETPQADLSRAMHWLHASYAGYGEEWGRVFTIHYCEEWGRVFTIH